MDANERLLDIVLEADKAGDDNPWRDEMLKAHFDQGRLISRMEMTHDELVRLESHIRMIDTLILKTLDEVRGKAQ